MPPMSWLLMQHLQIRHNSSTNYVTQMPKRIKWWSSSFGHILNWWLHRSSVLSLRQHYIWSIAVRHKLVGSCWYWAGCYYITSRRYIVQTEVDVNCSSNRSHEKVRPKFRLWHKRCAVERCLVSCGMQEISVRCYRFTLKPDRKCYSRYICTMQWYCLWKMWYYIAGACAQKP